MSNFDDLREVFRKALEIAENSEIDSLVYGSIPEWDSLGHMALVSEIEASFGVEFSTEEVIDLSSFEVASKILKSKGINF